MSLCVSVYVCMLVCVFMSVCFCRSVGESSLVKTTPHFTHFCRFDSVYRPKHRIAFVGKVFCQITFAIVAHTFLNLSVL